MPSSESKGFVDVHVHPPTKEFLIDAGGIHAEAAAKKFGHPIKLATFEEMLEEYSVCGVGTSELFQPVSLDPEPLVAPPQPRELVLRILDANFAAEQPKPFITSTAHPIDHTDIFSTLLSLSRFGSRLFHSLAPDADIAEQDKSLGFVFHDI